MQYFLFVCVSFLVPVVAFAAPKTVSDLAKDIVTIMNMATAVLISAAIAIYFWGIVTNYNNLSKDPKKLREFLMWGVFAIFIMVSIWGIVSLIKSSVLL